MSKLTPAIIDPTTDEGIVAARNYFFTHLIQALVDAPASVRNLVGRCKMHEFFRLFKPKMVQGAHWHCADGLFVRYKHYRVAEQLFVQARYAFYPELMPASLLLLTDPIADSNNVGLLSDWGGAWAMGVGTDKAAFVTLDARYPNTEIDSSCLLLVPKGEGLVLRAYVADVVREGKVTKLWLAYTADLRDVTKQVVANITVNQPFFVYIPPA